MAVAFKQVLFHSLDRGSIVSAGGEVTLPTGKEHKRAWWGCGRARAFRRRGPDAAT